MLAVLSGELSDKEVNVIIQIIWEWFRDFITKISNCRKENSQTPVVYFSVAGDMRRYANLTINCQFRASIKKDPHSEWMTRMV